MSLVYDIEQLTRADPPARPVTLTLVRYRWYLVPLAFWHRAVFGFALAKTSGLQFFKLLGSGRGGAFSLNPDWRQWGMLGVWDSVGDLERFFSTSRVARTWARVGSESWTVLLDPLSSHGQWSGVEPFGDPSPVKHGGPVAIITRATIRFTRAFAFWRNVAPVARTMRDARGLIMSVGVGEAPVFLQSTFSIWETLEDAKTFAYDNREHAEVIKKTRRDDWYKEDLFARLRPVATMGTLAGVDPLSR